MGNTDQLCDPVASDPATYKYPVTEVFSSVQGEGHFMGTLAFFIRFLGCNLDCEWCDTKQPAEPKVQLYTATELAELVPVDCRHVVLTGGEPCIQPLQPLVTLLRNKGVFIQVETNGTRRPPNDVWITCAPKPGARWDFIVSPDELKYVIDKDIPITAIRWEDPQLPVYLMPQDGWAGSVKKAMIFLERLPGAKLGIQAHKSWGIE